MSGHQDPRFDERRGPQGPPSRARGWYGHFPVGVPRRRRRAALNLAAAWDAAIAEDKARAEERRMDAAVEEWIAAGAATPESLQ